MKMNIKNMVNPDNEILRRRYYLAQALPKK